MRAVVHPEFVYLAEDETKATRHVSDFKDLALRPRVCCPQCHELVTLALGESNAHHYRHKPDSDCPLKGSRESIMHSNVKFHIRDELQRGGELKIIQPCINHRGSCLGKRTCVVVSNWDVAVAECAIDKFRADVGLMCNSKVVGVVEVWVKHKTEGEKADFLNRTTSWIEIAVDDENYENIMVWTCDQPLPSSTSNFEQYTCTWCEKHIAKQLSDKRKIEVRENRIARLEALPAKVQCLGIREIDFLFRSRKTYRKHLCLYADWREGTLLRTWIQFKGESEKLYEMFLPNDLNHVKNFYRKVIDRSFRLVEMSMQEYSMRSIDYYIHDARKPAAPEPPRFKFKEGDLPGSL